MAATSHDKKIWFFGGVGARGSDSILDVANDLWCFDTDRLSWKQIKTAEFWPSPRRCVGWLTHKDELFLWGGSGLRDTLNKEPSYSFLNDFWRFIPLTLQWELLRQTDDFRITPHKNKASIEYPFPRYTPVFQSLADHLFLFGGYTEDRLGKRKLNDVWLFDGKRWSELKPKGKSGYDNTATWPGQRYGCMHTCDDNYVYICGGFSDDGDHIDLWRFNVHFLNWELLAPDYEGAKFPRARYCAAFAVRYKKLYIFGGRSRQKPKLNFNDLWVFDLDAKKWDRIQDNRQPHRYGLLADYPGYHAKSATSVVDNYWYILGGEGINGHVSDFWRFNFSTANWELLQGARQDDPVFW